MGRFACIAFFRLARDYTLYGREVDRSIGAPGRLSAQLNWAILPLHNATVAVCNNEIGEPWQVLIVSPLWKRRCAGWA